MWVYVASNDNAGQQASFAMAALAGSGWPAACTRVVSGPCFSVRCPAGSFGVDAGAGVANAGAIQVTGSRASATLQVNGDGTYGYASMAAPLFDPGTAVNASAPGAAIPGFSVSVTAPTPVTVGTPALAAPPARNAIQVGSDLSLSWSGQTPGQVMIYLGAATTDVNYVSCQVDASAGSVTVPASLMGGLAGFQGILDVENLNVATGGDATYGVAVEAYSFALLPGGTGVSVFTQF